MIVYLINNKINNKKYIGITTRPLNIRFEEHLNNSEKDDFLIHKAIKKYGKDSFEVKKIDTGKTIQELKEKEIFYIKHYNTFYENCLGYNMTRGGDLMESGENHPSSKLTNKEVEEIIFLLKNTTLTYKSIKEKLNLNVQEGQIYYINEGLQWHNPKIEYPIRENSKSISKIGENNPSSVLTEKIVLQIIDDLINTRLTQKDLAKKYSVHYNTISNINNCKSWNFLHNYKNNIRKECNVTASIPKKQIDEEIVKNIIKLLQTKMTQKEISKKTGVGLVTISNINTCKKYTDLHSFKNNIQKESLQNK